MVITDCNKNKDDSAIHGNINNSCTARVLKQMKSQNVPVN